MSRSLICAGLVAVAAFFGLAAVNGDGRLGSGAWAGEPSGKKKVHRARKPARGAPDGSSPEEIARYFQLYGGYIDPHINKQTPGGPFDSGFFFDSGLAPNGGDSPYMN
jgi:hypothetical protein